MMLVPGSKRGNLKQKPPPAVTGWGHRTKNRALLARQQKDRIMVTDSVNNSNHQSPNPEEFARKMLWHICGLRAEIRQIRGIIALQCEPDDRRKSDALLAGWTSDALKLQQKLYAEDSKAAGLQPSKD